MKAIISRMVDGKFAETGTTNRMVLLGCTSVVAVIKHAQRYAGSGQPYQIELYSDLRPYGSPFKIIEKN